MTNTYDIVIVGGGMVGLVFAALLPSSMSVAVIDPGALEIHDPDDLWSSRVSAISHASEFILKEANAWSYLNQDKVEPYQSMHVWQEDGSEALSFSCEEITETNLGYIIENNRVVLSLLIALSRRSHVQLFPNNKIEKITQSEQFVECETDQGLHLTGGLLVGADGALSKVRELTSVAVKEFSYEQMGVVATLKTQQSNQHTAWQRFLKTGPIAFLPLAERQFCSMVWTITNSRVETFLEQTSQRQSALISAASDHCLGTVELESEPKAFPLVARHSEHYINGRVILIGDAAHTIHPLAGQGVNLGMLDAFHLSRLLESHSGYNLSYLREFERARKSHNQIILSSMTALNTMYESQLPAWVLLRNLGTKLINKNRLLKLKFIQQARGLEQLNYIIQSTSKKKHVML